jgi:hypothetical protein
VVAFFDDLLDELILPDLFDGIIHPGRVLVIIL